MGQQRSEGPTPAGGAYALALIDDETGRIFEISEHAADGSVLLRTYFEPFGAEPAGDETAERG